MSTDAVQSVTSFEEDGGIVAEYLFMWLGWWSCFQVIILGHYAVCAFWVVEWAEGRL